MASVDESAPEAKSSRQGTAATKKETVVVANPHPILNLSLPPRNATVEPGAMAHLIRQQQLSELQMRIVQHNANPASRLMLLEEVQTKPIQQIGNRVTTPSLQENSVQKAQNLLVTGNQALQQSQARLMQMRAILTLTSRCSREQTL